MTSSQKEDSPTALPPSLVTVATAAGAGLDLEVSWWSGPGQPSNPGLINPQAKAEPKALPRDLATTLSERLTEREAEVQDSQASSSHGVSRTSQDKLATARGEETVRAKESVVGMRDETADTPKDCEKKSSDGDRPESASEPESAQAKSRLNIEPASQSNGASFNGKEATSENGSRLSPSKDARGGLNVERSPREGLGEPSFVLTDAPYFPAECPVVPSEDRAVRAQLRHRIDEVHLRRMDDLMVRNFWVC